MESLSELRRRFLSRMLRPLVRFAIRGSLGITECYEILKGVFLEVAAEEMARDGSKLNASRLSLLTGVHRKDVGRFLRNEPKVDRASGASPLSRIINQWERDPRFQNRHGRPRPLSYRGEESEFELLVRSASSDAYYMTALKELERNQVVEISSRGLVRMLENVNRVGDEPERRFEHLSRNVEILIEAAEQNMFAAQETRNVQLRTDYDNVFVSHIPEIRKWLLDEAKAFHKRVREYLAEHDQDLSSEGTGDIGEAGAHVMIGTFSLTREPTRVAVESSAQKKKGLRAKV